MRFAHIVCNNLLHRRLRSVLTMAGVSIAVAAAVGLLSIARGYARSSGEYYTSRGIDIVVVRAGVAERLTSALRQAFEPRLKEVPHVRDVEGSLTEMVSMGEGDLVGIPLHGYVPGGIMCENLRIVSGRALSADRPSDVLLGSQLALALKAKIGDPLEIEGKQFEVAGVFQPENAIESNTAVTTLGSVQELMDRAEHVSEFQVRLDSQAANESGVKEVCDVIESIQDANQEPLGLKAFSTRKFVESGTETKLMSAMALAISIVALGLALMGILNTVWMSVIERTRDLGILRAIGWSRRRIIRMILCEAVLLSLFGAIGGVAVAQMTVWGLSRIDAARVFVHPYLDAWSTLVGMVAAIAVGALGAIYPAWKASTIAAAEAMRHE